MGCVGKIAVVEFWLARELQYTLRSGLAFDRNLAVCDRL